MAAAPVGGDQAVPAQHLQCLSYGLPADLEVFGQLPFAGQAFTGRDGAVVEFAEQSGGDPSVEGLVVGGRVVVGVVRAMPRLLLVTRLMVEPVTIRSRAGSLRDQI